MKNIEGYIKWLGRVRAGQRKAAAVVLAFSVAVSGNVFWMLRSTGTAMSDDPICGIEEHKHTDDCYTNVLVCEEEHEHTDECYETRLTCGLEEHTHGDKCYIDISSHEQKTDWEATVPELTGVPAEDIVKVAVSQTGYEEGADGYTRYGDWYGNPDGDWNVLFVSFCLNYAGIKEDTIPYGSGCWAWQVKLAENALLVTDLSEMPKTGDILLTDNDKDGKSDRAGIIAEVTDDEITVIEGDVDGKVGTVTYKADDTVFGYISLNAPVQEEIPAEVPEETVEAETVTYDAVTASGVEVHAAAPAGAFPEGVTMSAADVPDKDVVAQAEETVADGKELKGTIAVDITFTDSEGNEVEPAEGNMVDVSITIPKSIQPEGDEFSLIHIDEDGAKVVKNADVSASEVSFKADGFSIYVVTGTGDKDKDRVHAWLAAAGMGDMTDYRTDGGTGDNIINCRDYPYMLEEGDTVVLKAVVDDADYHQLSTSWNGFNFSDVISIVENENYVSGGKRYITATVTAKSASANAGGPCANGEAVVSLTGTDEVFSIQVMSKKYDTREIDFDTLPVYDSSNPSTMRTVHVNLHDSITFKGTPNRLEADVDWPYMSSGENPQRLLSAFGGYTTDPNGIRSVTCTADEYQKYDEGQIVTFYTNEGVKKVRVIVDLNFRTFGNYWELIDHADIEIADGGVYTSVSFDIGDDDGLIKTVTTFQSYVCKVNTCTLYDDTNKEIQFFSKEIDPGDGWSTMTVVPSDEHDFVTEDYWHDPAFVPGDSQYELTSKYIRDGQGRLIMSDKFFLYRDVDHVKFDVGLQIVPTEVVKYKKVGSDWVLIPEATERYTADYEGKKYDKWVNNVKVVDDGNLSEVMETSDSVIFDLGKRYVIDAYNKCPNHSGLDFTVHANTASVRFGATKELTNGVLREDDFTFELVDRDTGEVVSRTNDVNGKVEFGLIPYETTGTHKYYIREVDESAANPNISYDKTVYDVTVTVTEVPGSGGMLMADVSEFNDNYSFKFTNKVKIALPDTGGVGILPFMAGGVLLISSAVVLLMLRRRKEVDL